MVAVTEGHIVVKWIAVVAVIVVVMEMQREYLRAAMVTVRMVVPMTQPVVEHVQEV